jgi:pyruvate dehydrogenase E1 component
VASTVPSCVAYDPCYGYELAAIVRDGMRRMVEAQEDVFYYITVMNENYAHPAMPAGAEEGILRGMYLLSQNGPAKGKSAKPRVQLLGSGTILREVIAGAKLLEEDFGVASDIWSVTSFNELRRDGLATERWNRLHPEAEPRLSYVEQCLKDRQGPVVAATDYMKAFADQIRPFVHSRYIVLGTDGFGRSDTREKLRRFFEVDRRHVAVAALKALADSTESISPKKVSEAIKKYGIDTESPNPATV